MQRNRLAPPKGFAIVLALTLGCLFASAQLNSAFTYVEGCNGTVTFTSAGVTGVHYYWTFGDNTFDSGPVVTHQYAQGTYTVFLSAIDTTAFDSSSQQIYVGQYIQQQLNGPADICLGNLATFTLSNASPNLQYSWLTATGTILGNSQADSAQVLFSDTGATVVSVLISNGAGCDSILQQTIHVHPNPVLYLPGQGVDSGQAPPVTICQNIPRWFYIIAPVPGTITWTCPSATVLSPQGVDSIELSFPNTGGATIQINELTPYGCTDSITQRVTIVGSPVVTASGVNACLGSDNYFTATPTPPGSQLTYQWVFDDGATATGATVSHTFPTSGQHTAIVVATNASGCTDTATTGVSVDINPGPPITCVGPVCAGAQEVYTTSPVNGASYHWTITGGSITSGGTLNDNSVGVTWGNGQLGTIQLYLTGPGIYCQVPTVEQVQILGGSLSIQGNTTPCSYTEQTYSVNPVPGGIYNWTVGSNFYLESGQGTNQIQVYCYSTADNISVSITHEILSCSSTASLTVTPLNPFSVYGPTTTCAGITTTFSTYQAGNFNWTVQGGTIVSGNGTGTIQVLWNTAGTYNVTASIASGFCNTTAQTSVNVVTRKTETVVGSASACINTPGVYFISPNESAYAWTATGGTISGGTNSNSAIVTWTSAGSDSLMVIYTDLNGCPDTAWFAVNVAPSGIPAFTGDTVTCYGSVLNYTFTPVTGVAYTWQTDGGAITGGQNTSTVSVMWNGTQTGMIRLSNAVCNTFEQKTIVIRPTPVINFDSSNLTCAGTSADINVIQDYAAYSWSSGQTTQDIHITSPGPYSVTVSDAFGCTASATDGANPIPSLGFTNVTINVSYPGGPSPFGYVELTAVGTPPATQYLWSTGNQAQSEYTSTAGTYTVTMTNQYDCTATASATVTTAVCTGCIIGTIVINPCNLSPPIFTTNIPVCNPVQFTPATTANYWLWDFSDGVYSTLSNPSHRFYSPGTYTINMYYSNDGTNWYYCSQNITINSVMDVAFTYTGGCKGAVTLTDVSTSALSIVSSIWRLGDGNTSNTVPVLNYNYTNNASTYLVSLILNDGTCTDSVQQPVNVDQLNAGYSYTGTCTNNPVLFNDATVHSAIIAKYSWGFDNGLTADYYDPVTYYTNPAVYKDTLIVTDANGCMDTSIQNINITQFAPPTIAASGPLTFCQGSSVTLSLAAGYSYYWDNADTTASIVVTQTGNFFAWVLNTSTGCSGFTDTDAVIENFPPPAFIGNPGGQTQLCAGTSFQLTGLANGAASYNWYFDLGPLNNNQDQYTYYAQTNQSGYYVLVTTGTNGCKDTSAPLILQVNPQPNLPTITQTPNGNLCAGQTVNLSVTGTDLFQWNTGQSGTSINVTQTGEYEVIATNIYGCATANYDYVNFQLPPDFSSFLTGCYQICPNTNITVSGPAGMQSYLWSDGETTPSIVLNVSGTYSLAATATDGCSAKSDSFTVDVFSAANIQLGNDTSVCKGQPVVLDAGAYPQIVWQDGSTNQFYTVIDSGEYSVTVTTSQGCTASDSVLVSVHSISINLGNDTALCNGASIVLNASGFTSVVWQNGSTASTFVVNQAGFYKVTVTDAYGCMDSDSITVVSGSGFAFSLGDDTTICSPNTLLLTATGNFSSILWQNGSNASAYTVTQTGYYYATATNSTGCTETDSVQVTVDTVSVFIGDDTTLCAGISLVLNARGSYTSLVWQDGSTGNTYTVTQPGEYYVTASGSALCTAADSVNIAYYPNMQPDSLPGQKLCDSILSITLSGTYNSYLWSTGASTATVNVSDTGTFYVTVTDANGCSYTDSIVIGSCPIPGRPNRYYIPNVFSPQNNNGNNEFRVYLNPGTDPLLQFEMLIYDRWGEKMFETSNETSGWDGKYKGSYAPEGVYVYYIKYQTVTENVSIKGTVTDLR